MRRVTGELADLAETAATEAERLLVNAKRSLRRHGPQGQGPTGQPSARRGHRTSTRTPGPAIDDLGRAGRRWPGRSSPRPDSDWPGRRQMARRGGQPARCRCLADRRGRLGKPVEFGHKAQLVEGDAGADPLLLHTVERGNPADAPQLLPARRGNPDPNRAGDAHPCAVTADRGYGEKAVEDDLADLGVPPEMSSSPARASPQPPGGAARDRPAFRRTVKWRTGIEGRISTLKRGYGWDRTRIDAPRRCQIWTGHGVLTHNLVESRHDRHRSQEPAATQSRQATKPPAPAHQDPAFFRSSS